MTPAKCGIAVYANRLGAFPDAVTVSQLLRIAQPFLLVPQPRHRGASQRVEGTLAGVATVALQARSRSPAIDSDPPPKELLRHLRCNRPLRRW